MGTGIPTMLYDLKPSLKLIPTVYRSILKLTMPKKRQFRILLWNFIYLTIYIFGGV